MLSEITPFYANIETYAGLNMALSFNNVLYEPLLNDLFLLFCIKFLHVETTDYGFSTCRMVFIK